MAAGKKEVSRLVAISDWKRPVPRRSVPDNAVLVRTHLISSRKHIERAEEERVDKARMVALGDRLFNKHMKYLRDLEKEDVWQPAAGLDDIHFVQARATAHRRAMETIDLVTAYLQADLNSPYPIYAILEKEVIDLLPDDEKRHFKELEARGEDPVCEIIKALYGLGRSGFAFGVKFSNWLGLLAWIDMHEAPAVAFKWHPESCEVEMQRVSMRRSTWRP